MGLRPRVLATRLRELRPENPYPLFSLSDPRYMSRRPSMALSMVISSVYSMSLPTGIPMAMRVTFTPARLSCCER